MSFVRPDTEVSLLYRSSPVANTNLDAYTVMEVENALHRVSEKRPMTNVDLPSINNFWHTKLSLNVYPLTVAIYPVLSNLTSQLYLKTEDLLTILCTNNY